MTRATAQPMKRSSMVRTFFPSCDQCGEKVRFRLIRTAPYIFDDEDLSWSRDRYCLKGSFCRIARCFAMSASTPLLAYSIIFLSWFSSKGCCSAVACISTILRPLVITS